jgi:hypothetical protein
LDILTAKEPYDTTTPIDHDSGLPGFDFRYWSLFSGQTDATFSDDPCNTSAIFRKVNHGGAGSFV